MKMVKKILLGMTVAAAILALTSCKGLLGGAGGDINNTPGSSSATIDENNTGDFKRGFKMLVQDHLDAICHIENTVNALEGTTQKANGVLGYIFNYKKGDDGKASFSIAGVRYNQSTKKVEAYVETFKDVLESSIESDATLLNNGIHAKGNKTWSEFGFDLFESTKNYNAGDKFDVWIDVVANDGETEGRNGTAGSYTVRFFDKDPGRNKGTNDKLTYDNEATVKKLAELTIAADDVSNPFKKSGETKGKLSNMQSKIGYYYNVQPKQKLTGSWKFSEIKMEAEEIEE